MTRPWCAICQFPGKERFYLGTISARQDAPMHEIENSITNLMDRLFPTRPQLVDMVPGALTFSPEEST